MNGLSDKEVLESKKLYGCNKINYKSENKFIKLFIKALGDPIIKLMLIALSIRIMFMFKDANWYETLGMLISILLSSLISSLSEYGSNKSFNELQKKYENITIKVKRNGILKNINHDDIVVGDLVLLESGDLIPADGIVIDGYVGIDESSINGEADEVLKNVNDLVLKGCIVLSNKAWIKIKNVGEKTVYGNIIKELKEKDTDSPMKVRLTHLANIISKIGIIGSILVAISYLFNVILIKNNFDFNLIISNFNDINYCVNILINALTLSLTILIVCIPEGLPMMVALVLSSNMKRMLKNNVLVRKPVGIETCGSMQVLLLDKTGTLTEGKLKVIGIAEIGNTFNDFDSLSFDLKNALIYNNQSYFNNNLIEGSNSTDKAILKFTGFQEKKWKIVKNVNFNSKIKYSSVTLENGDIYYKGALEVLIDKCLYYIKDGKKSLLRNKKEVLDYVKKYTKKGMRVICIIKNNILLGFVLMKDTIRTNAKETLKIINDANISTIMITGDDIDTATSIAMDLNMLNSDSIILNHDNLVNLTDEDILINYKKIKVIARALPQDKSRIAKILEKNDLVVGMTGDGINDSPALKKSSVGISLGSGSNVAKEASDIVILDDNINSILNAILYGRTIFKSIRKFVVFQLTMNFSALFLSIVGPFIGITTPVTIMQMLWINMIMDTLAGLAYSYEAPLKRYLKDKPIKKNEPILNKYMYLTIILNSLFISTILVLFLKLPIVSYFIRTNTKYYLTSFFSLFIFLNLFNAFNTRTERVNIFSGILKNKIFIIILSIIFITQVFIIYYGGTLFRTFGLSLKELLFVLIISFSIVPFDIIKKILINFNNY